MLDKHLLVTLILPPSGPLLLGLLGVFLIPWRRQLGTRLAAAGLLAAYLLSIPLTASLLTLVAQPYPPLDDSEAERAGAKAIVVLAGGLYLRAPEYGVDTAGLLTLARVRYAAFLAHRLELPVIAVGGYVDKRWEGTRTEAEAMAQLLRTELGVTEVIAESAAHDTRESAARVAELSILQASKKGPILLVTDAMHSRRAVDAFREIGLDTVPAPTRYYTDPAPFTIYSWIPQQDSVTQSWYALYELVGRAWYGLTR
jgi:uncharacterized SAM-binding protein YcdF (DUF218 family)